MPRYATDLDRQFEDILRSLNPAQRTAVEHIEGPMLVVAGPGTGKTHILAARIANILRETDAAPFNILCLTFTDAAATAMKQRLLRFIGPDAYKVHVYTFHAFCNKVIQDHRTHFPASAAEPAGDLLRLEVLREVLDTLPPHSPLKADYRNPYSREMAVRWLLDVMKTEHWTPDAVREAIDDYVAELPYRDDFRYRASNSRYGYERGDVNQNKLVEEQRRMEQLRAAAGLYAAYEAAMRRHGGFDFSDMLLWVLDAFRSKTWMLRNYQEQYLYVLVDEYQDTNGAQNELVHLLASYWENPNLFIVGDDDQAIYEFQGARIGHIIGLQQQYPDLETVLLTDNYRSSQAILDASRHLIEDNTLRLVSAMPGLQKVLTARGIAGGALPRITEFETRAHEREAIVSHIRGLLDDGVPAGEIAVIVRRHAQYEALQALMLRSGIPCVTARPMEVWQHPVGQMLRILFEWLAMETSLSFSGETKLFDLLHHPYWGVLPLDIARVSLAVQASRLHWRDVISDPDLLAEHKIRKPAAILAAADILENLVQQAHTIPLEALAERIIHESGLMRYAYDLPDRMESVQVLHTFFEFVQAECARNPQATVFDLAATMRKMDENRLALRVNMAHLSPEGVQLLTAHASKGLEFEHVFIPDLTEAEWDKDRGGQGRFRLPDTLTISVADTDAEESRRRLLYVAMTRAKRGLYLSYASRSDDGKTLTLSALAQPLAGSGLLMADMPAADNSRIVAAQQRRLATLPIRPDADTLTALLADFRLSVSAMNAYLDCPLHFYFRYVLRAPDTSSPAAAYGTAMHAALEKLYALMLRHPEKMYADEDTFIGYFDAVMHRQQHLFTRAQFELRLSNGRKYLRQYYREVLPSTTKNVQLEYYIRHTEWQGVPISGLLDKIETRDDASAVSIIDYKTGFDIARKVMRPNDRNPNGGDYWRQLVFYKILYELDPRHSLLVENAAIQCLEPDDKGRLATIRADIRKGDVTLVTSLIEQVWAGIQRRDFFTGCGKPDCHWCRFVEGRTALPPDADADIKALDE